MSRTHWKQLQNNDWIGAYALQDGQDLTLTIDKAMQEQVTGNNGKREMCLTVHWVERDYKPMIVNRTNAKTITKILGSPYREHWKGKKIQLYPTTTRFGGDMVECIRVRPTAPKQVPPIMCEKCGQQILPAANMTAEQLADYGLKKYGKKLCLKCGKEAGATQAEAEKTEPAKENGK
jgi:hypothetical protein